METDPELWRSLKVGDRIRLVHMPTEFSQKEYLIHRDTLRAYRRLIARQRSLRICEIDEGGCPWIQFRFKKKDARWEHHWLLLNHDGLVKVRPRH
ncbi:MAG: hypothetical protein WD847_19635 [Pirellulales bacterium]